MKEHAPPGFFVWVPRFCPTVRSQLHLRAWKTWEECTKASVTTSAPGDFSQKGSHYVQTSVGLFFCQGMWMGGLLTCNRWTEFSGVEIMCTSLFAIAMCMISWTAWCSPRILGCYLKCTCATFRMMFAPGEYTSHMAWRCLLQEFLTQVLSLSLSLSLAANKKKGSQTRRRLLLLGILHLG